MPTRAEWAYIAGFLDGEGTIRAQKVKKGTVYAIQISNCDREILDWITEITGVGKISSKPVSNPKWKRGYTWYLQRISDIIWFLEGVEPYVKVKATQLEVMLDLLQHRLELTSETYNHPTTEKDLILMEIIHTLNRRGV